ncbi:MAG: hypothetical protein ACI8S6_000977 [Myxococcota bacterium]|jgi:hypothetical protein
MMVLLSACSEYDLQEKSTQNLGVDSAEPIPEEPPRDCTVTLPEPSVVPTDEECLAPDVSVKDPWSVAIEWTWRGLSTEPGLSQVMMLPAIGNLTDDDGDGLVTEQDIPDIVAIAFDGDDGYDAENGQGTVQAKLVLLSGTGEELWSLDGFYWKGGPAVADINRDGRAEIIAISQDMSVVAVSGDGVVLWTSTDKLSYTYPHVNVADIDADGYPEVLADDLVLSGATGATKLRLPLPSQTQMLGRMTVAADIDLDGQQEIIAGNACYSADGSLRWTAGIFGTYGHWSAILDADGDPEAEVAMVGDGQLGIYDHDGTELSLVAAGTGQPGPPCVADFDGDGDAEIAWASSSLFNVYELDGTVLWTHPILDETGLAGCSGYDVDGDGAYEVVYADERQLYIFDGRNGEVRFIQTGHSSGTIFEYPVIADVDNDDSAEIVMVSNNFRTGLGDGWSGVTVLGHEDDGWGKSGPTWNVHDFAVTNIEQNGRVPRLPDPSWQTYNVYRARPAEDLLAVDLVGEITDVCFAGCADEDIVRVAGRIYNQGETRARAGIPVALYRKDGTSRSAIALTLTESTIESGETSEGFAFEIQVRDVGSDGLEIWADDLGAGFGVLDECDNWNNGGETWLPDECP